MELYLRRHVIYSVAPLCYTNSNGAQFDAVKLSHLVDAEYGNQGLDFKLVPREGFGWMNGAFLYPPYLCLPANR